MVCVTGRALRCNLVLTELVSVAMLTHAKVVWCDLASGYAWRRILPGASIYQVAMTTIYVPSYPMPVISDPRLSIVALGVNE